MAEKREKMGHELADWSTSSFNPLQQNGTAGDELRAKHDLEEELYQVIDAEKSCKLHLMQAKERLKTAELETANLLASELTKQRENDNAGGSDTVTARNEKNDLQAQVFHRFKGVKALKAEIQELNLQVKNATSAFQSMEEKLSLHPATTVMDATQNSQERGLLIVTDTAVNKSVQRDATDGEKTKRMKAEHRAEVAELKLNQVRKEKALDGQLRRSEKEKKVLMNMSVADNDKLSVQDGVNLGIKLSTRMVNAERASMQTRDMLIALETGKIFDGHIVSEQYDYGEGDKGVRLPGYAYSFVQGRDPETVDACNKSVDAGIRKWGHALWKVFEKERQALSALYEVKKEVVGHELQAPASAWECMMVSDGYMLNNCDKKGSSKGFQK